MEVLIQKLKAYNPRESDGADGIIIGGRRYIIAEDGRIR